jgi:hypothetical protein
MTAITYGADTGATPASSGRKSLIERFINALYEARVRAARREINRYLHLVPQDVLKQAGYLPSDGGTKLPLT